LRFEHLESRKLLALTQSLINVDFEVGAMAADARRDIAYVVDNTNAAVLAFDTARRLIVNQAQLSGAGASMAVTPQGDRLYVAIPGAFRIDVFSLPDLTRTASIPAPITAYQIATDNQGRLYSTFGNSLYQLDATSGAVLATAPTANSYSPLLRTNTEGTRLYTRETSLSGAEGALEEFDIGGPSAPVRLGQYAIPSANGRDFAVDVGARRIYTADGGVYGVGVTNMDTNARVVWPFVSAAYGGGVSTREGSTSVFGLSSDPYNGGVFEFDKDSGLLKNVYRSPYTRSGPIVTTVSDHVVYTAGRWTGTSQGYVYSLGFLSPAEQGPPVAHFSVAQPQPDSFTFDASESAPYDPSQPITEFTWDFGDGTTSTGLTTSHRFSAIGTYTVRLVVTSSTGATDEVTKTVTVTELGGPLTVDRVESVAGVYRSGDSLTFTLMLTKPAVVAGRLAPFVIVSVGSRQKSAVFVDGSGTSRLRFSMSVSRGDLDLDGVSLQGSVRVPRGTSIRGLDGTPLMPKRLAAPSGLIVDGRPPVVVSAAGPAAGTYRTGDQILFKVRFSAPVVVRGIPYVALSINGVRRTASFVHSMEAAPNEIWFRYTIQASDFSRTGISVARTVTLPRGSAITSPDGDRAVIRSVFSTQFGARLMVNASP
jgi:PKD repeat protein